MEVNVRGLGFITGYFPEGRSEFRLRTMETLSIATVLETVGIPRGRVMAATVSGERKELSYVLVDGDELVLVSLTGGG